MGTALVLALESTHAKGGIGRDVYDAAARGTARGFFPPIGG